jgi:hypothetical protein
LRWARSTRYATRYTVTERVSLSNIANDASGLPSRGCPIEPGFTR